MTLGTLKYETGIWQARFILSSQSPHRLGFHPFLSLWVIKLKKLPTPGDALAKKDYDGFIFNLRLPVFAGTMYQKQFRILDWLKWDTQGVPEWIPRWWIMKGREPRKWLVALIAHRFVIRYPITLKFI